MDKRKDIVKYQGYAARKRSIALSDAALALVIIGLGALFIAMAWFFTITKAIIGIFAILALFAAFFSPEMVFYIFIISLCFPVPLKVGGLTLVMPDFAIFLLFFTLLMRLASQRRLIFLPGLYVVASGFMLLAMIFSSMASANISRSMPEIVQIGYYMLFIPFLVMNLAEDTPSVNKYFKVHALFLVGHAVLIIVQYQLALAGNFMITDIFAYANRGDYTLRSFGSIGAGAGLHLGVACTVLVSWMFNTRNPAAKSMLAGAAVICFYAILCTGTRSTTVFACVAIVLLLLYHRHFIEFMGATFAFFVGILFVARYGQDIYPFKLFYHGEAFRYTDIDSAMNTFYQNPLLGVGPMQFMRQRGYEQVAGVENEFVAQLASGGVVGAGAFIALLAVVIMLLAQAMRGRNSLTYETAGMVLFSFLIFVMAAFTVTSLFDGGIAQIFMLTVGYALAVHHYECQGGREQDYDPLPPQQNTHRT
jgi:hypothetical protein